MLYPIRTTVAGSMIIECENNEASEIKKEVKKLARIRWGCAQLGPRLAAISLYASDPDPKKEEMQRNEKYDHTR
jgi:hypothetical protein